MKESATSSSVDGIETYLQCASIWTDNPLSPLNKPLLIPDDTSNLDDITRNPILQNLDRLRRIHSPRQQLQEIPSFENDIRIPGLPCSLDSHFTLHQVELTSETVSFESRSDGGPN